MLACSRCAQWTHISCAGLSETRARRDDYECQYCAGDDFSTHEFYLQFFREQAEVLKPLPEDQHEYVAREQLPKAIEVEPAGPSSDSEDGEPQPSTSYQL